MTATARESVFCKVRIWKVYFCNWLRKNWPTLTSPTPSPPKNYHKILNPPFLFPLLEFQKTPPPPPPPPINMLRLKSWSPPLLRAGGGNYEYYVNLYCIIEWIHIYVFWSISIIILIGFWSNQHKVNSKN